MKGSKISTGYFQVEYGPTASTSGSASQVCSLQADLYNSGHHDIVLYVYRGVAEEGKAVCPLPVDPVAINVALAKAGAAEAT
jgi:hypothetical protein